MRFEHPSLRQGLVGCWVPSLGASGRTLIDRSGFNRHAPLTAPSAGQFAGTSLGLSIAFNGSTQFASTTISAGFSSSFTFAAWVTASDVALTSNNGTVGGVIVSTVASYTNYWANLGLYQGKWNFALFDGTNNPVAQDSASAVVNAWTHLVGKRDRTAGRVHCFVNGREVASVTDTTSTTPAYSGLQIGAQSQGAINRFTPCQIADARAYSRGLTPSEILTLYVRGPGVALQPLPDRAAGLPRKLFVNDAGTWRNGDAYVNTGSGWRLGVPFVNAGGTWK
jgi:hypothetical protein